MSKHPEKIHFPLPAPRLLNRFGLALCLISLLVGGISYQFFQESEYFWQVLLPSIPLFFLGLFAALVRKSQTLNHERKALIQSKEILTFAFSQKSQSWNKFARLRLSEEHVEERVVFKLYLEGQKTPVLLKTYYDANEAKQKADAISAFMDTPLERKR